MFKETLVDKARRFWMPLGNLWEFDLSAAEGMKEYEKECKKNKKKGIKKWEERQYLKQNGWQTDKKGIANGWRKESGSTNLAFCDPIRFGFSTSANIRSQNFSSTSFLSCSVINVFETKIEIFMFIIFFLSFDRKNLLYPRNFHYFVTFLPRQHWNQQ